MGLIVGVEPEEAAHVRELKRAKAEFEAVMAQSGLTIQEMTVDAFMLACYTKFKLNALCRLLTVGEPINDESIAFAEAEAIRIGRETVEAQLAKPMVARNMSEATRRY